MLRKRKKISAEKYYDNWTAHYLNTGYGDIIQAHRPPDALELLNHICKQADIADGMKILDAGCGICGPAIYIAQNFNVNITAITNSAEQVKMAAEKVQVASLKGTVEVIRADFHRLKDYFPEESFDLVLMLESFGHAVDKTSVLKGIAHVLKKEGRVYIKDYFSKEITGSKSRKKGMKRAIKNMNFHYAYNLADLNHTVKTLRKLQLDLVYIKKNELKIGNQDFVKEFEEKHNIDLFDGGYHYLFLEPLELFFTKPADIDALIT